MTRLFTNGKVILEDKIIENGSVLEEDGLIKEIFTDRIDIPADEMIDANGLYISPGFIDTHLHGGGGYDVMDADADGLVEIARIHRKHGCTAFLATTLTAPTEQIQAAIRNVHKVMNSDYNGARILGIHLEGPCFSMKFKGAQNPKYLALPSPELFDQFDQGLGIIRRISMAPELKGAFEAAKAYASKGVNISIAHSEADFACVKESVRHGFSHITHMYNGMSYLISPDYYCQAGVAEAGLLLDELTVEVIADGKHMPPEILQLIYKCKGPDRMLLTTDATRPTNMPEGKYDLSGLDVLVTDGVAMLTDHTSFAGSVATCDKLLRFAYKECGFKLHEAVKMASLNHAKIINMDHEIGSIKRGKRADIILFDDDIHVVYTPSQT
ncbi:MAG: N-acetylglucosamine-6-phosphate deacetylase [Defluviitaleaceae bacterium]|nr:N-acetylglucosamine-6-phosphate deacetylase [Defluviitaleaceae bacterium]